MKLSEIIITNAFSASVPSSIKLNSAMKYYLANGEIDKPLIVTEDNVLVDGYIRYLVLEMAGVEETNNIEIVKSTKESTIYIYGKHPQQKTNVEYCWKIPKSSRWNKFANGLEIGDQILCHTKFGIKPVIISKIVKSNEVPIDMKELEIKTVARRIKCKSSELVSDMNNILIRC